MPPEDIGSVVATLEDEGITYDSLTWKEPTLEDVYLELTGGSIVETAEETPIAGGNR